MPSNQPRTLAQTVARTLVTNVVGCALVGVVALFLAIHANGAKVSVDRPDVEASPAAAIAELEEGGGWCWTGGSDLVPNVVVFSSADGTLVVSRTQRAIDRAVEQSVFGVDHGMTVHAFCEA